MELNADCVRDVMKYLEVVPYVTLTDDGAIAYRRVQFSDICEALESYSETVVFYTLSNLEQAGFIDMDEQWGGGGLYACSVNFITYEGHEFLEKIKADATWEKTKSIAGKVGNFGLQMVAKIAEGVATAAINKQLLGG